MGARNMDRSQIRQNAPKAALIVVLGMLLATPASAAPNPGVDVAPLPLPVPYLGSPVAVQALQVADIPSLSRQNLPQVSGLPSRLGAISAAANLSNDMLSRAEARLDSTLISASAQIDLSRSLVADLRARLGSPTSSVIAQARDAGGNMISYTAYDAAVEMRDSIYTSTAYLRGLSNLGGVGLNLTFIIIGMAWIALVNFLDLVLQISVTLVKFIARLFLLIWLILKLIIAVAQVIADWINILTGPLT